MALKIYAGNQLEELARVFCEEIYSGNHSIFEQEKVVVQTKGIELFLRKYIAKNTEIAANIETPFLNRFVRDIMRSALEIAEYKQFCISSEQYSPEVLKWRIFDELLMNSAKYPEAEKYIKDSSYCYQLSVKLAETFDRYIWYHNDMLQEWRQKKGTHWESQLYLALIEKTGPSPDFFFSQVLAEQKKINKELLAGHYSLFGVGSMPPVLLELCNVIGRETDIHLFYLNPSKEYWGDITDPAKDIREGLPSVHNLIFSNLGGWGREFSENTVTLLNGTEEDCFISPGNDTMLHRIQEDIFCNKVSESAAKQLAADSSISVHNCHSKRREIEVLHNQLLLAIKELKVRPEDIIVMAPDINAYAPIIDAVFSSGKLAKRYNISDRSLVTLSNTSENLIRIIKLHSARCTAEEIFSIINSLPVRENFDIDEEGLSKIKNFISQAKICWGENATTRQEFTQTEFNEFSWQDGLDRLLLGYAADTDTPLATTILPAANVFGTQAELLGTLNFIVKNLFKWRHFLKEDHSAAEWTDLLNEIIDMMYGKAYSFRKESEFLKRNISAWFKKTESAQLQAAFPVKVLLEEMDSFLGGLSDSRGYLSGGITFCSLVPMRSIPAKVIAVLGLVAKDFPRKDENNGLNIQPARKKGERSRLLEDRYLFLETILAARERLLLLYPGQGTNPKVSNAPSAPLEDLINYLKKYFTFEETKHFRHAHDPRYFSSADPHLFSFSEHHCTIAKNIQSPMPVSDENIWSASDEEPSETEEVTYTIDDLAYCLYNPFRTFLTHTAEIRYKKLRKWSQSESEPLEVALSQTAIEEIVKGKPYEDLETELFLKRELPPGETGKFLFEKAFRKYATLDASFDHAEKVVITISVGKFKINGTIDQIPGELNIATIYKYGGANSKLKFYISSLCSSIQTSRPTTGRDIAYIDSTKETLPILDQATAEKRLLELLEIAEEAKIRPIPLFSNASMIFAINKKEKMKKAEDALYGDKYKKGDWDDLPFINSFFTPEVIKSENFVSEFQRLAKIVYAPWYQEEIEGE